MTNEEMNQLIQGLVVERLATQKWITSGKLVSSDAAPGKMAHTSFRFLFSKAGLEKAKLLIGLLDELGYTSNYRTGELDCLLTLLRPYGLGKISPDQALDPGEQPGRG